MKSCWRRREAGIRKISRDQADKLIDTRIPLGLFYYLDAGIYVGIDNTSGQAWTEAFQNLRKCKQWLSNPNIEAEC